MTAVDRVWILRATCALVAVILLAAAARDLVTTWATIPEMRAFDIVTGYLPGARRFLETGSPYTATQLAGSWSLGYNDFIHPPSALPLFAAFLVLPLPLWWFVPLALTGYAIARQRPAPWTWVVMALCLAWPRSVGALLTGNSDMWAMAAAAAGTVWGWPVVALAIKPTFAPFALLGIRWRSAWLAGVAGLAFMAVTAPLWFQWWAAIGNAHLGFGYSLLNLPLVALPLVAWLGRTVPGKRLRLGPSAKVAESDHRGLVAG